MTTLFLVKNLKAPPLELLQFRLQHLSPSQRVRLQFELMSDTWWLRHVFCRFRANLHGSRVHAHEAWT
jgi:hypothetical protein